MSWHQVPTETCDGSTLIPHPPGPAHDPAQLYYELAAGQLVLDLWTQHCSAFMNPFLFQDTLSSDIILPPFPEAAEQRLNEVRQLITQRYLAAWGREPEEEEWLALCQLANLTLILPDGTEVARDQYLSFVVNLWEACAAGIPGIRFMKLFVDGLTPENTADLPPELVEAFTTRRAEIAAALTDARGEPPTRPDWLTLAKLLAEAVAGPRQ